MTAVPAPHVHVSRDFRRVGSWFRNVAEAIYAAPAPSPSAGPLAKVRFVGYVVGSALAWMVVTLFCVGLLAAIFR